MCIHSSMSMHAWQMCMAANRKETKEFQISVYFVQIKAKIIKYGFKHTECRLVLVEVMFRPPTPPPPTTTPKLQLDFFDLKSSWSLGVVMGGVWCQTPPHHHHLKLWWEKFSKSKKSSWSFASNDIMCHILASNRIWAFKFFVGVGGVGDDPMHVCMCTSMHV